jgi:hypothetical protein
VPVKAKGRLMLVEPVTTLIRTLRSRGTGKGMLQNPTAFTIIGPTAGKTIPLVVSDPPIVTVLGLR